MLALSCGRGSFTPACEGSHRKAVTLDNGYCVCQYLLRGITSPPRLTASFSFQVQMALFARRWEKVAC